MFVCMYVCMYIQVYTHIYIYISCVCVLVCQFCRVFRHFSMSSPFHAMEPRWEVDVAAPEAINSSDSSRNPQSLGFVVWGRGAGNPK